MSSLTFLLNLVEHENFITFDDKMSLDMRKPAFCIHENKDVDQLLSNCAADQRLCFRLTNSIIPLLPKSEISSV